MLIKRLIGADCAADNAMIKQLTGTDEAAGRRCLSGLQVLINWLKDAIRAAESVLFNRLSGKWSSADQAADRCLTSG